MCALRASQNHLPRTHGAAPGASAARAGMADEARPPAPGGYPLSVRPEGYGIHTLPPHPRAARDESDGADGGDDVTSEGPSVVVHDSVTHFASFLYETVPDADPSTCGDSDAFDCDSASPGVEFSPRSPRSPAAPAATPPPALTHAAAVAPPPPPPPLAADANPLAQLGVRPEPLRLIGTVLPSQAVFNDAVDDAAWGVEYVASRVGSVVSDDDDADADDGSPTVSAVAMSSLDSLPRAAVTPNTSQQTQPELLAPRDSDGSAAALHARVPRGAPCVKTQVAPRGAGGGAVCGDAAAAPPVGAPCIKTPADPPTPRERRSWRRWRMPPKNMTVSTEPFDAKSRAVDAPENEDKDDESSGGKVRMKCEVCCLQ